MARLTTVDGERALYKDLSSRTHLVHLYRERTESARRQRAKELRWLPKGKPAWTVIPKRNGGGKKPKSIVAGNKPSSLS